MSIQSLFSRRRILIVTISTLLTTGCGQIRNVWHSSMTGFDPSTGDYADDSDEEAEKWVTDAGTEGRSDQPREYENDPLKKYLTSEKALSIERNLGYY